MAQTHPLVLFFLIAYLLSWLVLVPMAVFRAAPQFVIAASFGPCVAAVITHYLQVGNFRAFQFLGSVQRTTLGAASGIALIVLSYVVLPGILTANPARLHWSILLSTTVYDYSTLLGGLLGEEFGWRGYALPRLEARFRPILGSVIPGILWAGWHVPLFFTPGWTSSPFLVYLLIEIGLSLIISFGANIAQFAVRPAILMHASFNTVSRFLAGLFGAIEPSTPLSFELVLALCGLGVAGVLLLATKGRWAYRGNSSSADNLLHSVRI